jgi:hypothetical protein
MADREQGTGNKEQGVEMSELVLDAYYGRCGPVIPLDVGH